jgi:UDP-2,3-diacylglucosamine hydrolase
MRKLFISDLHLQESRPRLTRAFFDFLHTQATGAQALYILGDFFDAWVGDDDDQPLLQEVAQELKALSLNGTQIFLMHGNRDFLIGSKYAQACGAALIHEGCTIDLLEQPTLLLHGDSLCTDDSDYQQFRQMVRNPQWQQQILAQPLAARRALAAQLRDKSQSMNSLKAEDIMDVSPAEVTQQMASAGVTRLIHGHTHRPARHSLMVNNQQAERIVLGDWGDLGWCLEANSESNSLNLHSWPLAQ